jgi:PAS domain S-box-containing protein
MWEFFARLFDRKARRDVEERLLQANVELNRQIAALAASVERFRLLVDGTRDYALFLLDPTGHVASWNPGAERIKGYGAEDIVGRHFACFYPPEAVQAGRPARALEVAAAQGRYEEEDWRLRNDGSRFWASVLITALRDEQGKLRGFSKITRDVTERKQAEENARRLAEEAVARRAAEAQAEAIRREHEQLRVTLESIGDGVIVTDAAGRVTMLNPVAEALTGWTSTEAIGIELTHLFHIVNEDTRQPVENPAVRAQREGVVVGLANQTILIARDAVERAIDDSAAPIRLPDGNIAGVVLVFRDASERRRTELSQQFLVEAGEVLGSSLDYEQTLAALTRLAVPRLADWCSVWIRDESEPPRLLAVAHADPAKVQWAQELSERYPPDFDAPSGMGQVVRSGRSLLVTHVTDDFLQANVRDADHLAMVRGVGLKSAMIVPLTARGRTCGVMNFACAESGRQYDARDLALAEELMRRAALAVDNARLYREAHAALCQREQTARQLSLLIDASGGLTQSLGLADVLAAIVDLSHRLIDADAHAIWRLRSETGYWEVVQSAGLSQEYLADAGRLPAPKDEISPDPIVAENVQELPVTAQRHAAYRAEGIASMLAIPLRLHGRIAGTLVFYYRKPRTFETVTVRLATALANLAASAISTAELYERETSLRRRAEEADRRKDEFLALLGHELRNPLAPIRNAVQLLTQEPDNPVVVATARDMIGRQSAQMTRLVDELLDASRIARAKVQLRPERLDLGALVRTAVSDHRPQFDTAGLALEMTVPEAPVWIHGDATRLTQVLGNLLDNARKFTDRDGAVTVRLLHEGDWALLSVEDNGIGMSAVALPRLFEVFSQIDAGSDRSKGGLGLGLAVVKGLVELHGGTASARSDGPGRGSTFLVRLPVASGSTADSPQTLHGPHGKLPARRLRVLVVDDNVDAAESLAMLLRADGHQVEVAHDGVAALAVAPRLHPEVVLMDIGLPGGMDGYEVGRRLRGQPGNESVIVIALTGFGQDRDIDQTRVAGFWTHLIKPAPYAAVQELLALIAAG